MVRAQKWDESDFAGVWCQRQNWLTGSVLRIFLKEETDFASDCTKRLGVLGKHSRNFAIVWETSRPPATFLFPPKGLLLRFILRRLVSTISKLEILFNPLLSGHSLTFRFKHVTRLSCHIRAVGSNTRNSIAKS